MIIADTSGLLALFNRREPTHAAVRDRVEAESDPLIVSPYVIAELDYLVATRMGVDSELAIGRELGGGGFILADVDAEAILAAYDVVDRYRDQHVGLTDASLVVLARRFGTKTVLTLDRRHFSVLRPLDGGAFRVVP